MKLTVHNKVPAVDYKGPEIWEVPEGTTLGELKVEKGLDQHLSLVNNVFENERYVLQDGDTLYFIAVTSGG